MPCKHPWGSERGNYITTHFCLCKGLYRGSINDETTFDGFLVGRVVGKIKAWETTRKKRSPMYA